MTDRITLHGQRYFIVGAGAFGREIADWLVHQHKCGDRVIEFLDDTKAKGDLVAGRWLVRGAVRDAPEPSESNRIIISISAPHERQRVAEALMRAKHRFTGLWAGLIASTALRWSGDVISRGGIMCPGSVVSSGAKVGSFVHLNLGALVGHDTVIGDYCTLSSQVDIMGGAVLGNRVFVGSGARVLPGVKVGDDVKIHAGSVVMRCVDAGGAVMGNPARRIG